MNKLRRKNNGNNDSVITEALRRQNKRRSLPISFATTEESGSTPKRLLRSLNHDENSPETLSFLKRPRISITHEDNECSSKDANKLNSELAITHSIHATSHSSSNFTPLRKIGNRSNSATVGRNSKFKPHRLSTSTPIASANALTPNVSINLNNDFNITHEIKQFKQSDNEMLKTPTKSSLSLSLNSKMNNQCNLSTPIVKENDNCSWSIISPTFSNLKDTSSIESVLSTESHDKKKSAFPEIISFQWASMKPVVISDEAMKQAEKYLTEFDLDLDIGVSNDASMKEIEDCEDDKIAKVFEPTATESSSKDLKNVETINTQIDCDDEFFNSEDDAFLSSVTINEADLF